MEKQFLKNNKAIAIASILIAIGLWFYIVITDDPTRVGRVDDIPISYTLSQQLEQKGIQIINSPTETVSVVASGRRSIVTGVKGGFTARVDLSTISAPGYYNLPVQITAPEGVYIQERKPQTVEVYLDQYEIEEKPLRLLTEGTPANGYSLNEIGCENKTVKVTAPSMVMQDIEYLGATVDIKNISQNTSAWTPVEAYNKGNTKVKADYISYAIDNENNDVLVNVTLLKEKEINVSPVVPGNEDNHIKYNITPSTIKVKGDIATIDALTSLSTEPVDIAVLEAGSATASVILPENVTLVAGESNIVTLEKK